MIICSNIPLKIGTIRIPNRMHDALSNEVEPIPCFIVREATREEYENYSKSLNPKAIFMHEVYPYYYEISID